MTRPVTVVHIKSKPAMAKLVEQLSVPPSAPAPSEKLNPLAVAQHWLRTRLQERRGAYFLDGTPADLTRIMRETNLILKANGEPQVAANPAWVV